MSDRARNFWRINSWFAIHYRVWSNFDRPSFESTFLSRMSLVIQFATARISTIQLKYTDTINSKWNLDYQHFKSCWQWSDNFCNSPGISYSEWPIWCLAVLNLDFERMQCYNCFATNHFWINSSIRIHSLRINSIHHRSSTNFPTFFNSKLWHILLWAQRYTNWVYSRSKHIFHNWTKWTNSP